MFWKVSFPVLPLQVGHLQKRYLNALGCLWFNRTEVSGIVECGLRMH